MSGDLEVQIISGWSFPDPRPIQRPGNTVFRYWRTSQWKWAGLPSCWNMNVSMFCNCGISHMQHVQICHASNGFLSKEEWALHVLTGDCTKRIAVGRVALMLHRGMWVFRSPYSDIATIYCTADVECRFVTQLQIFQEMIIGTH